MSALQQGRAAFEDHAWGDAFAQLSSADEETPLDLDDLERLAMAAYLIADEAAYVKAWTRAHQEAALAKDAPRAARNAFYLAVSFLFKGDMAPGMGWVGRGGRVLAESDIDCSERAWLLTLTNLPVMFTGDPASALVGFTEAAEIAERFDDADADTLTRLSRGQSLVMLGRSAEGLSLLDEVMVAVTIGEVSPLLAGLAYCATIDTCQRVFDLRRAREWTAALLRWCASQPDLVPYRGNCQIHRCELLQLQGAWPEAMDAAEEACERLGIAGGSLVGRARYQIGEIHRLRGSFDEAEASYRQASDLGEPPEPGLSLLHLARGAKDVAHASISRALGEAEDPTARSRILPSYVDVMVATGHLLQARQAADELSQIARHIDVPFLHAVASQAAGTVALAEGDPAAALKSLREAQVTWRELEAPHDGARVRVLIALACRQLGDESTALMEIDAARRGFAELGAAPEVAGLASTAAKAAGGLTARELEVIALVASGKTNKTIAAELVLSEKTVARHIANIFTKLGVSSRSAATAYAYENDLV
jgi:DNA-binding CsgD family transcriptional regulator